MSREKTEINPIFTAIQTADLVAVQILLKSEIDLEQTDKYGRTPLLLAVYLGNLEIAKLLLEAGACPSCFNEHLMSDAIYKRQLDVVSFLIERGFDVNQPFRENENRTALIEAAHLGDIHIVKKLVESGADVNAISRKNEFALMNAACKGWQEIYDYLARLTSSKLRDLAEKFLNDGLKYRRRKDDELLQKFLIGAVRGDTKSVLSAIESGVNINAFGDNGTTALFLAVNGGHVSVVRALIEAGVDVNLGQEYDGQTPLMVAGAVEVVKLLIEAGADVNAETIEVGVDVKDETTDGWTALMAAANYGNIEVVKLLLEAGADINHQDVRKDTALSRAEEAGHLNVVQLLREAGATTISRKQSRKASRKRR